MSVADVKRSRGRAEKAIRRLLQQAAVRSFERWRLTASKSRATRVALQRAVARMLSIAVSAAFGGWVAGWERSRKNAGRIRQVAAHIEHRHLAASWNSWVAAWENAKRVGQLLRRTAAVMQHRLIASAWAGWADWSEQRQAVAGSRRAALVKVVRVVLPRLCVTAIHMNKMVCVKTATDRRACCDPAGTAAFEPEACGGLEQLAPLGSLPPPGGGVDETATEWRALLGAEPLGQLRRRPPPTGSSPPRHVTLGMSCVYEL